MSSAPEVSHAMPQSLQAVLVRGSCSQCGEVCGQSQWYADLKDTVIVLLRVVPQVNDLSPEDFRTDDPRDWSVAMLAGLVDGFLNRTGATTLPSLPEWTTLPDKARLLLARDPLPRLMTAEKLAWTVQNLCRICLQPEAACVTREVGALVLHR